MLANDSCFSGEGKKIMGGELGETKRTEPPFFFLFIP